MMVLFAEASLSFRLSPVLLICTKEVWGRGNPENGQIWMCFAGQTWVFGGVLVDLENRHDEGCGFGVPFRGRAGCLGREAAAF